ncbi:dodecin domain-containing protein [Oxalobacteraceae bacterium CAVE-383]|nr:dodecin domain-containing protein [Oxalobacteraceae bacterium CAVE-383]
MSNANNHIYKVIEIVGTSDTGTDDAIRNAITEAAKTVQHIDWFEMVRHSGHIADGKVDHFQATLKVGFRLNR